MSGAAARFSSALTSVRVSCENRLTVPDCAWPPAPAATGPAAVTVRVLVLRASSWRCTATDDPLPTATSSITAPTPIISPSTVSAERIGLEITPRSAMRMLSTTITAPLPAVPRRPLAGARPQRRLPVVAGDPPVAQVHHPVGVRCDLVVVGDDDDGAARGMKPPENGQDLPGRHRIQVARRLVCQDDRRVGDHRAGHRHPLLLAAGHLRRLVAEPANQPDRFQRRDRAAPAVPCPKPRIDQRQLHVVQGGAAGDEVEALEHKTDLAVADLGQLPGVERRDVHPVEQVPAAAGQVQAAEDVHQRALARARRAHDGHVFAALHRQRDAGQRRDLDRAQPVGLLHPIQGDDRSGHGAPPPPKVPPLGRPPPPCSPPPPPGEEPAELDRPTARTTCWPADRPETIWVDWSPTSPVTTRTVTRRRPDRTVTVAALPEMVCTAAEGSCRTSRRCATVTSTVALIPGLIPWLRPLSWTVTP